MVDFGIILKSRVAPLKESEAGNKNGNKGAGYKKKANQNLKVSGSELRGGKKKKKKKLNPLRPIYKFFRLNKQIRTGLKVICLLF